jgi:hypothetical protein
VITVATMRIQGTIDQPARPTASVQATATAVPTHHAAAATAKIQSGPCASWRSSQVAELAIQMAKAHPSEAMEPTTVQKRRRHGRGSAISSSMSRRRGGACAGRSSFSG